MLQSKMKLLQEMPVFGGIGEDILEFLLNFTPIVSVAKNEFFFQEGDDAISMFVLEQGKVVILKCWEGHNRVIGHFEAGDCFG